MGFLRVRACVSAYYITLYYTDCTPLWACRTVALRCAYRDQFPGQLGSTAHSLEYRHYPYVLSTFEGHFWVGFPRRPPPSLLATGAFQC